MKSSSQSRRLGLAGLVAGSVLAAVTPASAATQFLDFSGAICGPNGGLACSDRDEISQSYGDNALVDVSHRSIDTRTNEVFEPFLRYWTSDVGDLQGVPFGGLPGPDYAAEIIIKAADGFEVGLESFDLGVWGGRYPNVAVTISDLSGQPLFHEVVSTGWPTHTSLSFDKLFAKGFVIRWTDGYDNSLDNIRFDVRVAAASAVPEPATWAMMILGAGLVGAALRQKRQSAWV